MRRAEDGLPDDFWSVKAREKLQIAALESRKKLLEHALNACRQLEVIRHQTGFAEFLKSVEALRAQAAQTLVAGELSDAALREKRGEVRALDSMLALMTKPTQAQTLASELAVCEDDLLEARKRLPVQQRSEVQS